MRAALALALVACLAACKPELPVDPSKSLIDLSGPWTYGATGMRLEGLEDGSQCVVEGMTLEVGPWAADGLTGRTAGGVLSCTGALVRFSGPLERFHIQGGGNVDQYVSFEFGGPDWRHDGEIVGDTMRGAVKLASGRTEFHGQFRAVRR